MSDAIIQELPESIAKEFSVDEEGKGFVSRRGLARLSGVQLSSIRKLLIKVSEAQNLDEPLQSIAGATFDSEAQIPDIAASVIIKYYAYSGKAIARKTDTLLGAIGLRTVIQKTLNFQCVEKRKLTQEEIIELCILPVPSEWKRRFTEEYYDHLSRLTNLTQTGNSRPAIWARYTKELVYDWLPTGIYDAVKRCKTETDGYEKLHQFLSENGLTILENHQRQLLTLMTAASSMDQLKTLLSQSCTGNYQLVLIGR